LVARINEFNERGASGVMLERERFFQNKRGHEIFLRTLEAEGTPSTRTATIVHGLGEHTGRYMELASFLLRYQFSVFGIDLYGFGRSEGKRGDAKDIDDYIEDVKQLTRVVESKMAKDIAEKLLIGHSLGGLIALSYLEQYPDDYTHAIISSPAVNAGRNVNPFLILLSKLFLLLCPAATFKNTVKAEQLSDIEEVQQAYREDKLVHNKISPRLFHGMINLSDRISQNSERMNNKLKILFLHGEQDELVCYKDTVKFFESLALPEKEMVVLSGMKHETLNDSKREKTYSVISEWLEKNLE
jgi:alpha-beta hydrolase superfamily lysophospholipase